MRRAVSAPSGLLAAAAAGLAYAAAVERNLFTLRRFDVPVRPAGGAPLRLLHLSDLHVRPPQQRKQDWVRALDRLDPDPDLVIVTGDFLAARDAVSSALYALGPLLDRPGAFVPGNNDYYAPRFKNPLRYFVPERTRTFGARLPWERLRDALVEAGWFDATHARGIVKAGGRTIALAGVDDPPPGRDPYPRTPPPAHPPAHVPPGPPPPP